MHTYIHKWAFLVVQMVKNLPVIQETWVQSLSQEDPLEKVMANHSSILAWRIPWTDQYSCLENPMDRGAWRATGHRVKNSWTRLRD